MRILHDGLPPAAQAKLLPSKKVTTVSTSPSGVTVTCADGTTYTGTILVGADGAHSTVRSQMRSAAIATSTSSTAPFANPPLNAPVTVTANMSVNDEKPFLTSYRSMWIRFPTVPPIVAGDASETHGYDCTLQLFAGEETSVIGIYARLDKPTRDGARYTEEDEKEFVKRWGSLPVIAGGEGKKGPTIAEAYANRTQAGMVNLEEGVLPHWSFDRIVLVGDAAHKFTPSTGAGCNNGIVDVVALANELYHAFREVRDKGDESAFPDGEGILRAFKEYQAQRWETVKEGMDGASRATGAATWADLTHRFVDRHVLSRQGLVKFFADKSAAGVAKTPVFEYVEGEETMVGKFPWAHPMKGPVV